MPHVVGPKGQVVIERSIRQALNVHPGAHTIQRLVGNHVEIHFIPAPHTRSLRGALSRLVTRRPPNPDDTDAAWIAALQEREPHSQ